jgi:hypothetical protein
VAEELDGEAAGEVTGLGCVDVEVAVGEDVATVFAAFLDYDFEVGAHVGLFLGGLILV